MRLWSLHPRYLDGAGLRGVWCEGLLARKVLLGNTKGYTRHPQLDRFRAVNDSITALDMYLSVIYDESVAWGYKFDKNKIRYCKHVSPLMSVSTAQVDYEVLHLAGKLRERAPDRLDLLLGCVDTHPLFYPVDGDCLEQWERVKDKRVSKSPKKGVDKHCATCYNRCRQ